MGGISEGPSEEEVARARKASQASGLETVQPPGAHRPQPQSGAEDAIPSVTRGQQHRRGVLGTIGQSIAGMFDFGPSKAELETARELSKGSFYDAQPGTSKAAKAHVERDISYTVGARHHRPQPQSGAAAKALVTPGKHWWDDEQHRTGIVGAVKRRLSPPTGLSNLGFLNLAPFPWGAGASLLEKGVGAYRSEKAKRDAAANIWTGRASWFGEKDPKVGQWRSRAERRGPPVASMYPFNWEESSAPRGDRFNPRPPTRTGGGRKKGL